MVKLVRLGLVLSFCLFYMACTPRASEPVRMPGPYIRVLLDTVSEKDSLFFEGGYALHSEEARYEFGKKNRRLFIQPLTNGVQLFNQNRNLLYKNHSPIILKPMTADSRFLYHGQSFAGSIFIQSVSENSVSIVNKVLLEEYLRGVVPAEIPSGRKSDYEAIKAQAIAARTYAIGRLESNKDKNYDLRATIADQVYAGTHKYMPFADQAIAETKGVVITYNGQPATIYYHSTCGGYLEAAENIWPETNFPYLAGGSDAVSDVYSCSASPYFRWLENRSIDHLDSLFSQQYNHSSLQQPVTDTTTVTLQIKILKRTSKGRVTELQIDYADTSVVLSGYKIRRFLADRNGKYLPSNLFYFSQPDDSTLTIHGGGYGHGVGMCQYGALNMARRGFKHYHILNKYFPGTKLDRKY